MQYSSTMYSEGTKKQSSGNSILNSAGGKRIIERNIRQKAREEYSRFVSSMLRIDYEDPIFHETASEKKERIAHLLRPENYNDFVQYYFASYYGLVPLADFHKKAYEEVYRDAQTIQFRIWFRNAAKSMNTIIFTPIALMLCKKIKHVLVVGINGEAAAQLLDDTRESLADNVRIINDFGEQVKHGTWRRGSFETNSGCFFKSLGINQPVRGLRSGSARPDFLVFDDIEKRENIYNEKTMKKHMEKVTREIKEASDIKSSRMIVCNNLISKEGLIASLMTYYKNAPGYNVSDVPVMDENGKPAWEAHMDSKTIKLKEEQMEPDDFQSEYMNNPIEKGRIFSHQHIKYGVPNLDTERPVGSLAFWDLSYSRHGDYKACAAVTLYKRKTPGQGVKNKYKIIVHHVYCRKSDHKEALTWYMETVIPHMRKLPCRFLHYYDATAQQAFHFDYIFKDYKRKHGDRFMTPSPHKFTDDKYTRIESGLTRAFSNENIFFHEDLKASRDLQQGIIQLLAFELGSTYSDDFPDALDTAIKLLEKHFGVGRMPVFIPVKKMFA